MRMHLVLLDQPLRARANDYLMVFEDHVTVKTPEEMAAFFKNELRGNGQEPTSGELRRLKVLSKNEGTMSRRAALRDLLTENPNIKAMELGKLASARGIVPSPMSVILLRQMMARDLKALVESGAVRKSGKTYSVKK